MDANKSKSMGYLTIAFPSALVLGALLGYVIPQAMLGTAFVGRLFFNALTLLVIPVLVTAAVTGMSTLMGGRRIGRAAGRALLYFGVSTAAAVVVGIVVVLIVSPGRGVDLSAMIAEEPLAPPVMSFSDLLAGLVSGELFDIVGSERYLGPILLSLVLGAILATMGVGGRPAVSFFRAADVALRKLLSWMLYALPIAMLSLVGAAVASGSQLPATALGGVGWLVVAVLIALVLHGTVLLPLAARFGGGKSAGRLATGVAPALWTALATGSSAATFPFTYKTVADSGQVDTRAAALVVPAGMVINRNGSAIYMAAAALFVAQLFGVSLGIDRVILVGLMATVVSFLAAGVPITGLLMLPVFSTILGLDIEQAALGAGLLTALDWLLIRVCSVVDVWGDVIGSAVVSSALAERRPEIRREERLAALRPIGRGMRDRERERPRGRREERVPGRRTERHPALPAAAAGTRPTRPLRSRPEQEEGSPFRIQAAGGPLLEATEGEARPRSAARVPDDAPDSRPAPRGESPRGGRRRSEGGRGRLDASRGRRSGGWERRQERPPREPAVKSTPPETPSEEGSKKLDASTVARELARVSEHLRRIDTGAAGSRAEGEEPLADTFEETIEIPDIPEDRESPAEEPIERDVPEESDEQAEFAFESREIEPVEGEEPTPEEAASEPPSDEGAESGPAEHEAAEWGRRRRFKDPRMRNEEAAPPAEGLPEVEVKERFTSEGVSFGRSKRKRIR